MQHRAFTLIELVAVLVILAILAGVALPRYLNYSKRARASADNQMIAAINSTLIQAYTRHRMTGADTAEWITTVAKVPSVLETGQYPAGTSTQGSLYFFDQRGNRYLLFPETETTAARFMVVVASAEGGPTGAGSSDVPLPMAVLCLLPWASREQRRGAR